MIYVLVDLSTLANVVTTLATMDKKVKLTSDGYEGGTTNGGVPVGASSSTVAKAFDTLAKAIQPRSDGDAQQVRVCYKHNTVKPLIRGHLNQSKVSLDSGCPSLNGHLYF